MIINHIFRVTSCNFSEKQLVFQQGKPGNAPAPAPKGKGKVSEGKGNPAKKAAETKTAGEKELEAYFKNMNANKKAGKKKGPKVKVDIGPVTYTYVDSKGKVVTKTEKVLTPKQMAKKKRDNKAAELLAKQLNKEEAKTLAKLGKGGVDTKHALKDVSPSVLAGLNAPRKKEPDLMDRIFKKKKDKKKKPRS